MSFVVATSTAVERVFSQGRQLLSFTRNCLHPSTIRAFLCLGSWGRNDLIFFEDVLAAVKGNSKRKRELSDSDVEVVVCFLFCQWLISQLCNKTPGYG